MTERGTREGIVEHPVVRHFWLPIESAPKGATSENPCREHWILGTDGRECKVIRWCMEYPCSEGVWMYAYEPADYIDGIQQFYPTHWMPLPSLPNAKDQTSPEKSP